MLAAADFKWSKLGLCFILLDPCTFGLADVPDVTHFHVTMVYM